MPYKKDYSMKTVKMGNTRTPASVMGSQGKPAKIKPHHFMSKPTGMKKFTAK